jgi:hypothetical protein
MNIEELKSRNWLLFECISGSRSYGTNLPTSDTDIKGVFVLPQEEYYGLRYVEQINNASNDIVYYELKRFIELLNRNNPNILEMLNTPEDCVLYKHPLFNLIRPEMFLSKLCKDTFAGYAISQIQKARGLNKKILNPVEPRRKDVLDFCYITSASESVAAREWLESQHRQQELCGLVNVPHMKNVYALYYDTRAAQTEGAERIGFKGIFRKEESNDVAISSVPKGMHPVAYLYFNKDGYSTYCKDYKEYWDWVSTRNEERYANTLQHGKNYDAKNMMHTIRLLEMASEIALHQQVIVRRPNRDYLLQIRWGEFSYEELVNMAEAKTRQMEELYKQSHLPNQPDYDAVNALLVKIRKKWYENSQQMNND